MNIESTNHIGKSINKPIKTKSKKSEVDFNSVLSEINHVVNYSDVNSEAGKSELDNETLNDSYIENGFIIKEYNGNDTLIESSFNTNINTKTNTNININTNTNININTNTNINSNTNTISSVNINNEAINGANNELTSELANINSNSSLSKDTKNHTIVKLKSNSSLIDEPLKNNLINEKAESHLKFDELMNNNAVNTNHFHSDTSDKLIGKSNELIEMVSNSTDGNIILNDLTEITETIEVNNISDEKVNTNLNSLNTFLGRNLNNEINKIVNLETKTAHSETTFEQEINLSNNIKLEIKENSNNKNELESKDNSLKTNDIKFNEINFLNTNDNDNLNKDALNNNIVNRSILENRDEIIDKISYDIKDVKEGETTTLNVSLKPKELGEINIKLVMKDGFINGNILVENDSSKEILERQLNSIKEELKNADVNINKLDVNLSNNFTQNSNKENMFNQFNRKIKYNNISNVKNEETIINDLNSYNSSREGNLLSLYG